ncbi:MAG: T9SS type A sorting domain-containing protein, partial [Bacteroidota bacterium]
LDQLDPEMLVAYHTPWGIAARPDEGQVAVDSSSFGERLPQSVAGALGWVLRTQGDFFGAEFTVKEVGLVGMGSDALGLGFGARYPQPLRDFSAQQKGAGHLLSWTSERELLTTEYEILHSIDGEFFESLGVMDAKGRDSVLLSPTDYENLQSMNEPGLHYYAVLLHHANGYTIASDTVSVKFELSKLVRAYPNPLGEKLFIDPDFEWKESLILQIFDSRRTVFVHQEWKEAGGEMSVEIPNVPPGIYFFQVQSGELTIQGKLLKTQ